MNKKLLCTTVGATLVAAAGSAQANFQEQYDIALVPYVVKDANRTTVVSVVRSGGSSTYSETLHIQYWTKSTTDANTAACKPSSVYIPYTPNDVLTWDTAGILGYPLFGDTTNPAPLGTSISYAAPQHGYAWLVTQERRASGSDYLNAIYWLELDLANGGAIGDTGFGVHDTEDVHNYFSDNVVLEYNSSGIGNAQPVVFWPSSVASTVFTVTPLGTAMDTKENNQVVLQVFNDNEVQGAYDRNENGVDGTVPVTVRCVGRVTPAQLMPGVVANAAWAAQGGWGNLANLGDNASTTNDYDAVVYQVDSASAAGKFMSNATRISSDTN